MAKHQYQPINDGNNDDIPWQDDKGRVEREIMEIEGWINNKFQVDPEGIERREMIDNNNNCKHRFHIRVEDTEETQINGVRRIKEGIENPIKNGEEMSGASEQMTDENDQKLITKLVAMDSGTSKHTHRHGEEKNRLCIRSWKLKRPVFFNTPGGLVRSERKGIYIIPALDNLKYEAYIIEGGMDLISPFLIQKSSRKKGQWIMITDRKNPIMKNKKTGREVPLIIINEIPYLDLIKTYKNKLDNEKNKRLKKNARIIAQQIKMEKGKIENLEFFNKSRGKDSELNELILFILEEIKKENIRETSNIQMDLDVMNIEESNTKEYCPYHNRNEKDKCKSKNHLPGDSKSCIACLLGKYRKMPTRRTYRRAFNKPQLEYLKEKFLNLVKSTITDYKEKVKEKRESLKFGDRISMDVTFSSELSSQGDVCTYTIKDKATNWQEPYPIKGWPKAQTSVDVLKEFISTIKDEVRIGIIRTDNGSEFTAKVFKDFIKNTLKAMHHTGIPYAPETELDHESLHAVMNACVRAMLVQSGLPVDLWPYAVKAYFWLRNRFYKNPNMNNKTAYEKRFGLPYDGIDEYTWGQGCVYAVDFHMPFYEKYASSSREGIIIGRESGGFMIIDVQHAVENKGELYIIKSNKVKLIDGDFPGRRYNFSSKYRTEKWDLKHKNKIKRCTRCSLLILENKPNCKQCINKKNKKAHTMDPSGCREAACKCTINQQNREMGEEEYEDPWDELIRNEEEPDEISEDESKSESDIESEEELEKERRRSPRDRKRNNRYIETISYNYQEEKEEEKDEEDPTEWDLIEDEETKEELYQTISGKSLLNQLKLHKKKIKEMKITYQESMNYNEIYSKEEYKEVAKMAKKNKNKNQENKNRKNINDMISEIETEMNIGRIIGDIGATKKISTAKARNTTSGRAAIIKEVMNILSFETINKECKTWEEITKNNPQARFADTAMLMVIKNAEMAIEDQITKARLVILGNKIKDINNEIKIHEETLYEKPIGLAANLMNIAYGSFGEDYTTLYADIKNAYCQAQYGGKEELWISIDKNILEMPEIKAILEIEEEKMNEIKNGKKLYFKINRSLYGTDRGAYDLGIHLRSKVKELEWIENKDVETNLYYKDIKHNGKMHRIIMTVYVDDVTLSGPREIVIKEYNKLAKIMEFKEGYTFKGRTLGHNIHNIRSEDKNKRIKAIEMKGYIEMVVEEYKIISKRELIEKQTPMNNSFYTKISPENLEKGVMENHAASFKGKLLWLSRTARPDITFAVHVITRYGSNKWNKLADEILYNIICYLNSTKNLALFLTVDLRDIDKLYTRNYTDSDYGGCISSGRSTSGYVCKLVGEYGTDILLDWGSKRQGYVSNSSAESEIIALSYGLNMGILPTTMLSELITNNKNMKTKIYIDSKAAMQAVQASYSIKLRYLSKTQRLSISRLNEILFGENDLNAEVEYINTVNNIADFFTKALDPIAFQKHRESLGMRKLETEDIIN
jgi:hypothetical protein